MNVEIKRTGQDKDAFGAKNTMDLVKATPEPLDMLEGRVSEDSADRAGGKGKILNGGDHINAWTGTEIKPEVILIGEVAAHLDETCLPRDLKGADLQDRSGQVEGLAGSTSNAVEQTVHGVSLGRVSARRNQRADE